MARPRIDRSQRKARASAPRRVFRPWGGLEALEDRTLLAIFYGSASGPGVDPGFGRGGAGAIGSIADGPSEQVGFSFGASMSVTVGTDKGDPEGTMVPVL